MSCTFIVNYCIRGYHVYQRIWTPVIGEILETVREPDNKHDKYAMAVLEEQTKCIVGHIPQEISSLSSFFIRRGGTIIVQVTGQRERSSKPDGGLEVPCVYTFSHKTQALLDKAKELLKEKGIDEKPQQPLKRLERKRKQSTIRKPSKKFNN